jgi:multidrug resistance protein
LPQPATTHPKTGFWGQVLLLAISQAFLMFAYGAVLPILPYYLHEFGAGAFEYGLLVATFSIFAFLAAGPFGSLSDRVGRKPIILISLVGSSISLVVFGLSNSLILLFIARAAEGFFTAGLWPSSDALVSDIVPAEKRGSAWGSLLAGRTTGMIFGPTLGGFLVFFFGIRVPFFINAALAAIALLLCLIFIREPLHDYRTTAIIEQADEEPSLFEKLRGGLRAYRTVLLIGGFTLVVALIIRFTRIFTVATMEPMFAIYTTDSRTFGFTSIELGIFFFFFAASNAICQLMFGRLSDTVGHELPMALGGIVSASGLILSILATTTVAIYMVAVLLGMGGAMALPSSTAVAASAAPATQRGRVMGLMGMAGSAARAIGPILGGFFYASVLILTDSPFQAALIPVTIAILASIVGTVAVLPLMIKSRKPLTSSVNRKPFEEE